MSANVTGAMNITLSILSCFNFTSQRISETFAYCLQFVVSLVGNALIGLIVYKTKILRKPTNFFIVNMAMSDLLYPIFLFPRDLERLHINIQPWLIGGPLDQVLCKLIHFAIDVSSTISIQSLVLIAVDRFVAEVFPIRSPLISSKHCRFYILATWIIALAVWCPNLLVYTLVEYPTKQYCMPRWNGAFDDFKSFLDYNIAWCVVLLYVTLALMSILYFVITLKRLNERFHSQV